MGQQRKRPAAGMQSNHSKQSKQPRKSEKDVTVTQEETVDSLPNDLFENLDEEMNVDTTEDIHDQTNFSDNENMGDDDQVEEEEVCGKSTIHSQLIQGH